MGTNLTQVRICANWNICLLVCRQDFSNIKFESPSHILSIGASYCIIVGFAQSNHWWWKGWCLQFPPLQFLMASIRNRERCFSVISVVHSHLPSALLWHRWELWLRPLLSVQEESTRCGGSVWWSPWFLYVFGRGRATTEPTYCGKEATEYQITYSLHSRRWK
jgi:hypothetical protein